MLIFKIANVLVTQHKQHQEKLRKKLNDSRSVAATRDYLLEGTPSLQIIEQMILVLTLMTVQ